jgi:hypothetical protein
MRWIEATREMRRDPWFVALGGLYLLAVGIGSLVVRSYVQGTLYVVVAVVGFARVAWLFRHPASRTERPFFEPATAWLPLLVGAVVGAVVASMDHASRGHQLVVGIVAAGFVAFCINGMLWQADLVARPPNRGDDA